MFFGGSVPSRVFTAISHRRGSHSAPVRDLFNRQLNSGCNASLGTVPVAHRHLRQRPSSRIAAQSTPRRVVSHGFLVIRVARP
jgi:hypothetical protein